MKMRKGGFTLFQKRKHEIHDKMLQNHTGRCATLLVSNVATRLHPQTLLQQCGKGSLREFGTEVISKEQV